MMCVTPMTVSVMNRRGIRQTTPQYEAKEKIPTNQVEIALVRIIPRTLIFNTQTSKRIRRAADPVVEPQVQQM